MSFLGFGPKDIAPPNVPVFKENVTDQTIFNSQQTVRFSNSLSNLNLTSKSIGDGLSDIIPTDFKAFTNSGMTTGLQNSLNSAASGITGKAQGMLNSLTGGFGATEISSMLGNKGAMSNSKPSFAVKLESPETNESITFAVMPVISEQGQAIYDEVQMPHHPGAIVKYNHTASRAWSVSSIKLISRTVAEADKSLEIINMLRTWKMPYYGAGTGNAMPDKLGAPPPVLKFSAYGKTIDTVPVVLEGATWSWPNDVDYIHTSNGDPFPVIISIDLQLKESWSPSEFSGFDLTQYRAGNMSAAYPAIKTSTPIAASADSITSSSIAGSTSESISSVGPLATEKSNQALSFGDKTMNVMSNIGHGVLDVGKHLVVGAANTVVGDVAGIANKAYNVGSGLYNSAGVVGAKLAKLTEPYNGK